MSLIRDSQVRCVDGITLIVGRVRMSDFLVMCNVLHPFVIAENISRRAALIRLFRNVLFWPEMRMLRSYFLRHISLCSWLACISLGFGMRAMMQNVQLAQAATALLLSMGGRRSVPESLRNEQKQKARRKCDDNGDNPEDPTPAHRVDDGGADQRHNILASQQKQGVNSEAVGFFVKKVDFCDRCAGQAFYRGDRKALENAGNEQGDVIRADGAPDVADEKADAGRKVDRSLAVEDRSR